MRKMTTPDTGTRRWLMTAVVALSTLGTYAQNAQGIEKQIVVTKSPVMKVDKIHTIRFTDIKDEWNPVLKTVRTIHQPGVDARKDEFLRRKAEANAQRDALMGNGAPASASKVTSGTPPTQGMNFFGNTYDFSDPADNGMDISEGGKIVSVHNTRVHIYQHTSSQSLSATSLGGFVSGSGQPTNFTFDPKVTYDPDADKWVVVFLNGASPSSSRIIVCFSETNDPTGNWNVYGINGNLSVNGNPLGVWTDFPQIGLNTNELFITGNLFTAQNSNLGSAIWQVNKNDGYTGASQLTITSHHLPSNFSLHPVEGALNLYGPHMYFLESDNSGANTITLHRISNSIANNGVLENPIGFTMNTSYAAPPDADQKGSNNNLATNDCRVQNSYFQNNRIEFTLNTAFGGRSGIFHGTGIISPFLLSFSSFSGQIISPREDLFAAYGAVGYGGMHLDGSNKTYVTFNYCGPNDYPACGAVYVDSSGISPFLTVKAGVNPVNSAQSRWGDYADCNAWKGHEGTVWMVGTYGNTASQQRTYISELMPPIPLANNQPEPAQIGLEVYPNPSTDRVTFDFPVDVAGEYKVTVHDLNGRLVHTVIQDYLRLGEGRVSFNTTALASGQYVVVVANEQQQLLSKKFNVTR